MTAEVVSLRQGDFSTPEVLADLIKEIDDLRKKAEAGEIKGFSFAYVDTGDFLHTSWVCGSAGCSRLVGATALLQYRLSKAWDDAIQ